MVLVYIASYKASKMQKTLGGWGFALDPIEMDSSHAPSDPLGRGGKKHR
jgi:hypothetical protein